MRVNRRAGLDLQLGAQPGAALDEVKTSSSAALLGREFPGLRFDIRVEQGMLVRAGEPLAHDRHRPEIVFTAPLSGVVSAVNRGKRRSLLSIQITADDAAGESTSFAIPDRLDKATVRQLMLVSGSWTALKKRPFGHIPDPDQEPQALLITAIDTDPLAPNPETVISAYEKYFERGLQALSVVIDGPIYLCQSPDANIPGGAKRIQRVQFSGPHPAGLPGHHIHALSPIGFAGNEVWHIGYQDVIALGHLLARGKIWLQRVVSLAGAAVLKPRVLTVALAAATDELLSGELQAGAARIISGSALSGYTASGAEAFLGQRQRQITVLPEMDAILGGEAGPLIPVADLQKLSPGGVLAVPLMRALLIGDIERARDLGALELVEEDLALITYACPSKNNYGQLLRDVLDQLHTEMI